MMKKIIGAVLITFICFGCRTSIKHDYPEIHYAGSIHDIMSGKTDGVFPLDSLEGKSNIYALGLLEGMDGEVQVFAGQPYISYVQQDSIQIKSSLEENAALIVFSEVDKWKELNVPLSVTNMESLIGFLEYNAEELGLNMDRPHVYFIEGTAKELRWHVMQKPGDEMDGTRMDHDNLKYSQTLEDSEIEILAYYSKNHMGVFTHHNSPVHMHFMNKERTLGGHVDDIDFENAVTIRMPEMSK